MRNVFRVLLVAASAIPAPTALGQCEGTVGVSVSIGDKSIPTYNTVNLYMNGVGGQQFAGSGPFPGIKVLDAITHDGPVEFRAHNGEYF
jgi:hypothetical protein